MFFSYTNLSSLPFGDLNSGILGVFRWVLLIRLILTSLFILWQTSVLSELCNLALQGLHILRKSGQGIVSFFALVKAGNECLTASLPLPPPDETAKSKEDSDDKDSTQSSPSSLLLNEQLRETQKEKWADEEDSDNVDRGDKLRPASRPMWHHRCRPFLHHRSRHLQSEWSWLDATYAS